MRDDYLREGSAELFFNVFKGLAGGFHSTAHQVSESSINNILQFITEIIDGAFSHCDEAEREYGYEILTTVTELTVNYIKKHKNASLNIYENALLVRNLCISTL